MNGSVAGFNPSVGILFVHTQKRRMENDGRKGFNPSVGILFVHTSAMRSAPSLALTFQSLGRDSVCSYQEHSRPTRTHFLVSIPRSGFCLFILGPAV